MPAAPKADVTPSGTDDRVLRPRGQRTRLRLLEAAAEVFAAKGFHAARVDDIVRAAHSSHGTFYLYFSSKEELFEQLVAEVTREIETLVESLPLVADSDRGRPALRGWLDDFADLYQHYGPVIRTWTEAELPGDQAGRQGDDALGALVLGIMARVRIPKGSGLDPAVATLALVTMCERLNYYASTNQVKATRDELLDTLVDIIDAAVFGPTA
jgi:AcrR family transcriptional regulator